VIELNIERKEKTAIILQEMKKDGLIRDFLQTGNLTFQSVVKGIDFFVVYVDNKRYNVLPLSITREKLVKKHQNRHPNISVIGVDSWDTVISIKHKIIELIRK
jgi:hypothetical protein